MGVGCGLWACAPVRPAAVSAPESQPGSSGSLWEAVELQRPLLADSSRALELFTWERPPFLRQVGLIYPPGLAPEMCLGFPGSAKRGGWIFRFIGVFFVLSFIRLLFTKQ